MALVKRVSRGEGQENDKSEGQNSVRNRMWSVLQATNLLYMHLSLNFNLERIWNSYLCPWIKKTGSSKKNSNMHFIYFYSHDFKSYLMIFVIFFESDSWFVLECLGLATLLPCLSLTVNSSSCNQRVNQELL